MIGAYFALLSRRIDDRPEDDPLTARSSRAPATRACSARGAGGRWCSASPARSRFAGLAIGWWLSYIGIALGVIGLVGWVFEFSRGQHAH